VNQHSHDAVSALANVQTNVNALPAGRYKAATQTAFNELIAALALGAPALGPLRRGHELPHPQDEPKDARAKP
jgi:hypothetical protein